MTPLPSPLAELSDIARRAGEIAVAARRELHRELKPDGSIVTNADREVETWLRYRLPTFVPATGIWGEEFGCEPAGPNGVWLVDPVDGTSNFAFGSPLWGVSIALSNQGVIEMGAIFLPDLNEMYVAGLGLGAYRNGQQLNPIPPGPIRSEELVSYGDWVLADFGKPRLPGKMRVAGAFVIDGAFVATQRYRGMIGKGEHLYDAAASIAINLELGADIRYVDGRSLNIEQLSKGGSFDEAWMTFPAESGFLIRS